MPGIVVGHERNGTRYARAAAVQPLNEMGECTQTKWRCSVAQRHEEFLISVGKTCLRPLVKVTTEKGAAPADEYEVGIECDEQMPR
jgi:hypothetical protein